MRPRARWLVLITLGTLVFVVGTWRFVATWNAPASDPNLLATGLAGAGLLLIVIGTVGMVASGLAAAREDDQGPARRSNAD